MDSRLKKLLALAIILMIVAVAYGVHRFFIAHDYTLQYEAVCDPSQEQCFMYVCTEDDEEDCEPYLYKLMQKHAGDIRRFCGTDVRDCPAAAACQPEDTMCSVEYCDPSDEEQVCAVSMQEEITE